MKTKALFIACVCAFFTLATQAQTQVIAHRGFWKAEGSAQNSITGLNKAAEAKVYGSEFDVQLTADNTVVVNHDDIIGGWVIADTEFDKLKDLKLKKTDITYDVLQDDGTVTLKVRSSALAKSVYVECRNAEGRFSDNFFDLEPQNEKVITFVPENDTDVNDMKFIFTTLNP